jgi:ATP-dependent Clp protease ATP-binding subunit ClpX
VRRLIAGPPGVCICDECVDLCNELIAEEPAEEPADGVGPPPPPRDIHTHLDRFVVGQEEAKTALAVAVHNHYKRVRAAGRPAADAVELAKSNVLLIGPTGCGKTYLAQTLARLLRVPFAIADATTLTQAGYVGEDVESVLLRLLRAADHDVARAETGIVYLDEVDKIARRGEHPSQARDVSGEGVQQALLKIVEGAVVDVPLPGGRGRPQEESVRIDTRHVLFILGGAFDGLTRIVERRTNRRGIGFAGRAAAGGGDGAAPPARVLPEDLVEFGLIPELVGRLPVVTAVRPLDRAALVRVLTEPRGALLKQYRRLFELDGVELEFTQDAVAAIAERALRHGTGARAARAVLETVLLDAMFDVPGRGDIARVVVDRDAVLGRAAPALLPPARRSTA